jgi:hypothetical protein
MVTPLHFAHLYNFISCNSSQSIKNLDGMLRVSQITLNTELLLVTVTQGHEDTSSVEIRGTYYAHPIDYQVARVDRPSLQLA